MEENSYWKWTYEQKMQSAEDRLVELSGVDQNSFKSYKIDIYEESEQPSYIWTYEIGNKNQGKETILLVHGYGGSGMIFYLLLKELSEKYHVVMMDLLGMGRSARPKFTAKTPQDAEDFFILAFEKWRIKMELDKMVILWHSFGGYISGRYAIRYPDHIRKIIFISSLGIDKKPEDGKQAVKNLISKQPFLPRMVLKMYNVLPFKSLTPFMPLRALGRIGSPLFVKYFIKKKMSGIPKDHFSAVYHYLYQIFFTIRKWRTCTPHYVWTWTFNRISNHRPYRWSKTKRNWSFILLWLKRLDEYWF